METKDNTSGVSYYDRISRQWKNGTWNSTIQNAARRGVVESLLEEQLQHGTNKWKKGLFEGRGEGMEEDHTQSEQSWRTAR